MNYWEKRAARDMWYYMDTAEKTADQISKLYYDSAVYLTKQIEGIFRKYQTDNKISEAEARRLINKLKTKADIHDAIRKLENTENTEEEKALIRALDGAAYRGRIARLEALQDELDTVMQGVYRAEKKISHDHYIELAEEAYDRTMFNLQQQAGVGFSFSHISTKQIDRALSAKWSGENYSRRIWSNTEKLAEDVRRELTVAMITGRTERETSHIIMQEHLRGASVSRRLVRTESNYLATHMQMEAYKEAGIEKYRYTAVLDLKTSEICRKLDGKVFPVKDKKPGVNCPPMHPWCRSTTTAVFSPEIEAKMKRSALDPETGKHILVPRSMTYAEWYKQYVQGPRDAIMKSAKDNNIQGTVEYPKHDVNIRELKFDDEHINGERKHNVTRAEAERFIRESTFSVRRYGGRYQCYFSKDGAAYVDVTTGTIRTAFKKAQFDERTAAFMKEVYHE